MRRYVGLLGGLHVGGRVHKRVLLVTEVSLGSALIRIAVGVGSSDGIRDKVVSGVHGRFENMINKLTVVRSHSTESVYGCVQDMD